jgi:hypothetical protein
MPPLLPCVWQYACAHPHAAPAATQLYNLPQGGNIKLYKGLQCPLDEFELLLFQLAGEDGKTYPLCPFCYNHPPFEGVVKVGAPCKQASG